MNASRYNIELEAPTGGVWLYNTANGAFAHLDTAATPAYRAFKSQALATHKDCKADIQNSATAKNSELFEALITHGFLTCLSPTEELAEQQRRFDAARTDTSTLSLCFGMTYACNFACPYCYEQGHNASKKIMGDEVVQALWHFIDQRYEEEPFEKLWVEWYGGDPSLALARLEEMSTYLIAWCNARNVAYEAAILTNCNLIDQQAVDMLKRCAVKEVFITIDGPRELHNVRRRAIDGSDSYQKNIDAAKMFAAAGIHVAIGMNVDKVNWPYLETMQTMAREELGAELNPGKLNDYGNFFGTKDFKAPAFDLFTHEEFAYALHEYCADHPMSAAQIRAMLKPVPRFCRGQLDNYYVIDNVGDVYKCDGWMGDKKYCYFNLLDDPDRMPLKEVTFDATRNEKCSACNLLPICHGSCIWERVCSEDKPCHPLKHTIKLYLQDYGNCLTPQGTPQTAQASQGGFTLLAPPFSEAEIMLA